MKELNNFVERTQSWIPWPETWALMSICHSDFIIHHYIIWPFFN